MCVCLCVCLRARARVHADAPMLSPCAARTQNPQNLSKRLRAKEEEAAALKITVQKECEERMVLMGELLALRAMVAGPRELCGAVAGGGGHGLEAHGGGEEARGGGDGGAGRCVSVGGGGGLASQFAGSDRSPSCPPTLGYKGDKGWGLLPNIARGPSPAQLYDARVTKERVSYGGRLKRL